MSEVTIEAPKVNPFVEWLTKLVEYITGGGKGKAPATPGAITAAISAETEYNKVMAEYKLTAAQQATIDKANAEIKQAFVAYEAAKAAAAKLQTEYEAPIKRVRDNANQYSEQSGMLSAALELIGPMGQLQLAMGSSKLPEGIFVVHGVDSKNLAAMSICPAFGKVKAGTPKVQTGEHGTRGGVTISAPGKSWDGKSCNVASQMATFGEKWNINEKGNTRSENSKMFLQTADGKTVLQHGGWDKVIGQKLFRKHKNIVHEVGILVSK